jgi:hypothetical protein
MAASIYALCALTSIACAVMLFRGYRKTGTRLLFWACLCFAGIAINNTLVFIDEQIVLTTDLSVWRSVPALLGIWALVYGMIWDVR